MIDFKELTQNTIDGEENPFKALNILKKLTKEIKDCINEVEEIALEESKKYEKSFKINGLNIERRAGRRIWNFKNIEEWQNCEKAKKECEERAKAAYSAYEKGLNTADENGEITILPEVSFTKDVIIIKELK